MIKVRDKKDFLDDRVEELAMDKYDDVYDNLTDEQKRAVCDLAEQDWEYSGWELEDV